MPAIHPACLLAVCLLGHDADLIAQVARAATSIHPVDYLLAPDRGGGRLHRASRGCHSRSKPEVQGAALTACAIADEVTVEHFTARVRGADSAAVIRRKVGGE